MSNDFDLTNEKTLTEEPLIDRLHRCRRFLLVHDIIDKETDIAAYGAIFRMHDRLNEAIGDVNDE